MQTLVAWLVACVLLTLPVRLAAMVFKAGSGGWLRSFGVLVLGAMLVHLVWWFWPHAFGAWPWPRALLSWLVLTPVCAAVLDLKIWQAALLALFLSLCYRFGVQPGQLVVGWRL